MHYTIYQTTNLLNNKIYIGAHETENPNDNYLGSGLTLKPAIKKHGNENFTKEILFICDSREEMYDKEAVVVNEAFVARDDTYNLKIGGCGGSVSSGRTLSEETKKKISESRIGANNTRYKGASIGTHHETGEVIRFEGTKALIAAGFNSGHVSNCIQGKGSGKDKNQHKGYIWTRE